MTERHVGHEEQAAPNGPLGLKTVELARERLRLREQEIVKRIAHGPFTDRMDEYARKLLHVREAGKLLDAWDLDWRAHQLDGKQQ